jgi:hypothetical protein
MQPCCTHDPPPARLLGELFREDRTPYRDLVAGFDDCWQDNIRVVLNTVPDRKKRQAWASAFGRTREAWPDAFAARGARMAHLSILAESDPATLHQDEGDVKWAA